MHAFAETATVEDQCDVDEQERKTLDESLGKLAAECSVQGVERSQGKDVYCADIFNVPYNPNPSLHAVSNYRN